MAMPMSWVKMAIEFPQSIEAVGFPITVVFSPSGRAFFSERISGNLWEVIGENFLLVKHFPILPITGHHETGLLGIALDPDFEENNYIYAYYTQGEIMDDAKNRIVRLRTDGSGEEVIYDNIPAGYIHNGGVMVFGPDKKLYVGIGVQNEIKELSQDLEYLGGKILRLNPDGSIPDDNPLVGSPIYSLGHRNIFGLAFHPLTNELYACDVGPDENDEINIIERGGNYGWPEVMGKSKNEYYINPIHTWTPTLTPTQCCFMGKDLLVGSYNEGTAHKLTLGGESYSEVVSDDIVYRGKSFGVIGVFTDGQKYYVTTPTHILNFEPVSS
jgi:glucose/arabinose dehydrogenase